LIPTRRGTSVFTPGILSLVVHECDDSTNCQANMEDPLTGRRALDLV
jgi:hypothetical protein